MNEWQAKLATALDTWKPTWVIDMGHRWLPEYAYDVKRHGEAGAMERLRNRVAQDLFHPIVSAAVEAGVVADAKES